MFLTPASTQHPAPSHPATQPPSHPTPAPLPVTRGGGVFLTSKRLFFGGSRTDLGAGVAIFASKILSTFGNWLKNGSDFFAVGMVLPF